MAVTLLYGSETRVLTKIQKQNSDIRSEISRAVNSCTRLDRLKNVDVRTELNMEDLNSRINDYRTKSK